MEAQGLVKQTWQQLVERLSTRFNSQGYQVAHFQHDDIVYGSCFMIWSNNEEALRLTWDGKECWFILEETILPIIPLSTWNQIIVSPFDPDVHDITDSQNLIDAIIASLD